MTLVGVVATCYSALFPGLQDVEAKGKEAKKCGIKMNKGIAIIRMRSVKGFAEVPARTT